MARAHEGARHPSIRLHARSVLPIIRTSVKQAFGLSLWKGVLCVDERSQIQALDRTQPVLPLRPGVPARQTHDYIRHGTTTLFAALNILDGTVIGTFMT